MKSKVFLMISFLTLTSAAWGKDPVFHQQGTITEMNSVDCGYDENSGKSFVGELVGTDGAHKKTREMLCQEYTVRTDRVVYRIRPREEKHPVLLPVGERADFRIKRDKMLLSVAELDGKEREYSVVSITQASASERASAK